MSQVTVSEKWAPEHNTIPFFLLFFSERHWSGKEFLVEPPHWFHPDRSRVTSWILHIVPTIKLSLTESEKWSLTLSKERQLSPLSSIWPHLKRFIPYFVLLESNLAANNWERRLTNYPRWWKKQFLITEEPLSPLDYSLSGESFISEVVKGQVQSSDSLHPGLKSDTPNAQSISAWTLTIFSHVFDLASDTAMASRWGLKRTPVFIQGNGLWITHSVSVQKDLIHCCWGPSGSLNLQCSEVNIATVLVPSSFTRCGPWGLTSGLIQVQWLRSEYFC